MVGRRGINPIQGQIKNMSYIKEIIYACSPISRAEIAEKLSLTPATITNNVARLLELGLIQEKLIKTAEDNPVGRRPIMLEYIPDAKYAIGVEISFRGIYVVICNICGEIIYQTKSQHISDNYDDTIAEVVYSVEKALLAGNISREKLLGLGVGVPRFADYNDKSIESDICSSWDYKKFGIDLENRLGFSVCVDNNASVRALSKGLFDRSMPDSFAYLFVSRGIACPVMIRNHIISREMAGDGEIGHMVVNMEGSRCDRCGDYGCLDTYSGELAIQRKCIKALERGETTYLHEIVRNNLKPTIAEIIEASSRGDRIIDDILDNAIKYLAVGICNVIKFIAPEMVVIDAYILSNPKLRYNFLAYIEQHISQNKWSKVSFVFREFDEYGGATGSAAYAIKRYLIDVD